MGQYHYVVNLTKRQFIHPHKLGAGLKQWEQLAASPGTAAALLVLLAHPERRGGGDLSDHSKEDGSTIVGSWAGDRIAMIGDYAEDGDLRDWTGHPESDIYRACADGEWTDVSDDVCAVLAAELDGEWIGDGWRDFKRNNEAA